MAAKKAAAKPKKKPARRKPRSSRVAREIRAVLDHPLAQLARAVMPQAAERLEAIADSADGALAGAGERAREGLAAKTAPFDSALASALDRMIGR